MNQYLTYRWDSLRNAYLLVDNPREQTLATVEQLEAQMKEAKWRLERRKTLGEDNFPIGAVLQYESATNGQPLTATKISDDSWAISGNAYVSWEQVCNFLTYVTTSDVFLVTELTQVA